MYCHLDPSHDVSLFDEQHFHTLTAGILYTNIIVRDPGLLFYGIDEQDPSTTTGQSAERKSKHELLDMVKTVDFENINSICDPNEDPEMYFNPDTASYSLYNRYLIPISGLKDLVSQQLAINRVKRAMERFGITTLLAGLETLMIGAHDGGWWQNAVETAEPGEEQVPVEKISRHHKNKYTQVDNPPVRLLELCPSLRSIHRFCKVSKRPFIGDTHSHINSYLSPKLEVYHAHLSNIWTQERRYNQYPNLIVGIVNRWYLADFPGDVKTDQGNMLAYEDLMVMIAHDAGDDKFRKDDRVTTLEIYGAMEGDVPSNGRRRDMWFSEVALETDPRENWHEWTMPYPPFAPRASAPRSENAKRYGPYGMVEFTSDQVYFVDVDISPTFKVRFIDLKDVPGCRPEHCNVQVPYDDREQ
ncbi:hypothetical protein CI109_100177 [Kwoniella shandongensis]|uniref:Uncharacterized protein n=1 Tax=Kwoniella shandongensis TaxID=1734106 RepID=A0A5M6BWV8_9TREE|nr:uncharacterized protein CI109_005777 [Kwoniella shandongensis]KAA5525895.1 hypothetical protein CI109_005777 [Kwoniella shandongensis]